MGGGVSVIIFVAISTWRTTLVLDTIKNILVVRKTSDFGVFAVAAKPPILEVLRVIRKTSDFGVFNIINNISKLRKASDFGVFAY